MNETTPIALDGTDITSLTKVMARWVADLDFSALNDRAKRRVEHAMLDWFGVALAGLNEPVTQQLIQCYAGQGPASVIGTSLKASAENAALINGSASHALDYDDVSSAMFGHPSVAILPALLGLGEEIGATMRDVIVSFAAGTEVAGQLGQLLGKPHYDRGFHATATHGSVAAAAACAKLLGLSAAQIQVAIAIGATQAAGLKSNFGTMTKPFHAGRAAMNGVMAARLAAAGFTAKDDILECDQGYMRVMSDQKKFPDLALPHAGEPLEIERNLYKFHAACALTHSAILAATDLRENAAFLLDDINEIRLYGDPAIAKTCAIADPKSGLDVKFSVQHVIAAALLGHNTAAPEYYSDTIATDPNVKALRDRVRVESLNRKGAAISYVELKLHLSDGRVVNSSFDTSTPVHSDDQQRRGLVEKFTALVAPRLGSDQAAAMADGFDGLADSDKAVSALTDRFTS